MKRFKIMLAYDSGKRYIFPIDILAEVLGLTDETLDKIETVILKEIQKNG